MKQESNFEPCIIYNELMYMKHVHRKVAPALVVKCSQFNTRMLHQCQFAIWGNGKGYLYKA